MNGSDTAGKYTNRRKVLLLIGAAGLGVGIWTTTLRRDPFEGAQLDAPEALRKAAAGEITLVDIRTPKEWEGTGIGVGAIPLDMRLNDFTDQLLQLLEGDPDRPVALICARGVRSARLAGQLTDAGFTNIIDVPEGMLGSSAGPGWIRRGLEVVR